MTIDNIPEVTIVGSGRYVIADLWDQKSGAEKRVFWSPDPDVGFHEDLAKMLEERVGREIGVNCYAGGGGHVWFEPEYKRITIGDWSMTFGYDDKVESGKMLQKAYPDFLILVAGTRGHTIDPPLPLLQYEEYMRRYLERYQEQIRSAIDGTDSKT